MRKQRAPGATRLVIALLIGLPVAGLALYQHHRAEEDSEQTRRSADAVGAALHWASVDGRVSDAEIGTALQHGNARLLARSRPDGAVQLDVATAPLRSTLLGYGSGPAQCYRIRLALPVPLGRTASVARLTCPHRISTGPHYETYFANPEEVAGRLRHLAEDGRLTAPEIEAAVRSGGAGVVEVISDAGSTRIATGIPVTGPKEYITHGQLLTRPDGPLCLRFDLAMPLSGDSNTRQTEIPCRQQS
jgi:hypothetical protein